MPGKNLEKLYVEDGYYHVYSRGVNRQDIFKDKRDYATFLNLFKRYLSLRPVKDNKGREYPHYHGEVELLAFCLMPNHFHAFIYQHQPKAITLLFKSVITTYSMYFNKRYKRKGPLFESRFRASLIQNEAYFQHVSRYIHLNPKNYKSWAFSSLPYYLGQQSGEWINAEPIMSMFSGPKDYAQFCADYEDHKEMLDEIKHELANTK